MFVLNSEAIRMQIKAASVRAMWRSVDNLTLKVLSCEQQRINKALAVDPELLK